MAPKPGRYHEGCAAGDSSQTGQVRLAHTCASIPHGLGAVPCEQGSAWQHSLPAISAHRFAHRQVAQLLLRSLAERGTYDQPDFCARLDAFLSTLDGTPYSSPYTDVAMRDLWRARKARPASVAEGVGR